jgi:molecular chaperone DnaK (HSP70)
MNYERLRTNTWIGIDFGTYGSKAAICKPGREPELVVLDRYVGAPVMEMRTAVLIDHEHDRLILGRDALLKSTDLRYTESMSHYFKLQMAASEYVPTHAPKKYRWADLVTAILRHIKRCAIEQNNGIDIKAGVITVPTTYTEGGSAWQVMQEAANAIGLDDVMFVREPEAAGVYLNALLGADKINDGDVTMVYDFGGGTYDPAFILRSGNSFRAYRHHAQTGTGMHCGGAFIDELVLDDIAQQCPGIAEVLAGASLSARPNDIAASKHERDNYRAARVNAHKLHDFAREIKERLSTDDEVMSENPVNFETYRITRQRFSEMIAPTVEGTIECYHRLAKESESIWQRSAMCSLWVGLASPLYQETGRG